MVKAGGVDESLGWGQGRWRDGKEGRVLGELNLSDGATVASTAASTRSTAAPACPSFVLILTFASWFHYFYITVIHGSLCLFLFLVSLYHQACHSSSEASSILSLCSPKVWILSLNAYSHPLLSLLPPSHTSGYSFYCSFFPSQTYQPVHPWQSLMESASANCPLLEKK